MRLVYDLSIVFKPYILSTHREVVLILGCWTFSSSWEQCSFSKCREVKTGFYFQLRIWVIWRTAKRYFWQQLSSLKAKERTQPVSAAGSLSPECLDFCWALVVLIEQVMETRVMCGDFWSLYKFCLRWGTSLVHPPAVLSSPSNWHWTKQLYYDNSRLE